MKTQPQEIRVVVGAQWGDEGKGKIVDLLSADTDYVIRYQGGANAGHTLEFGDRQVVLHLIPSGVFNGRAQCVIGNGVVVDPLALHEEIQTVEAMGVELRDRFWISETAHVILPYHRILDRVKEAHRGAEAIGTTGRGIGPAYVSKVSRVGIRMGDLLDSERVKDLVAHVVDEINPSLKGLYGEAELDAGQMIAEVAGAVQAIRPYIMPTTHRLHDAVAEGRSMLLEGAQGSLLDVDHGTYPYVTSSSPTSGGACTGSGIPPTAITHVMGITKAYCTRVGNGPFPSELEDETGEALRRHGREFGATTGRPRRCGWLDLVALDYSARLNGFTEIALTKLDVLDHFERIRVCVAYEVDGKRVERFPLQPDMLERVRPVWEELPGWKGSTTRNTTRFEELPDAARSYVEWLEERLGVPFAIVSTGPRREETIVNRNRVVARP